MRKLLLLLIISISFGQISSPKHGGGLNIGDRGAGIFYHRHLKSFEKAKIGATIRWTDIRPSTDIPSRDYYTGTYKSKNSVSLAIFPLFGVLNYYPFEGQIANNFSPFITLKAGPILVLDADEEEESFFKRWSKPKGSLAYGGNIGIGVEFRQPGKYYYSIEISYDLIKLSKTTDFYDNLNGTVLSFSIHR